jgi:hypothetical protein
MTKSGLDDEKHDSNKKSFYLYIKNFNNQNLQDEYFDILEEVVLEDNDNNEIRYEFTFAKDNTFCLRINFFDKNSLWRNYEILKKIIFKNEFLNVSLF